MLISCVQLFAQTNTNSLPKLSANLQHYLVHSKWQTKGKQELVYAKMNGVNYVSGMLKVNENIQPKDLTALGVIIGTKAKNIWTFQIPEDKLADLTTLPNIEFIQMDEPLAFNMDIARKASRVDSVQNGIDLPMAYTGKNVVVGIIDAGFDYTHPTFYDTTGRILRIKRVWEQRNEGTPPQGFQYGNELTDTAAMIAEGNEVTSFSHGTHVGGIAAGSGFIAGNNVKYRGVAYESDLVFVGIRPEKNEWKTMGMSSIIDAVSYIFTYAQSVGKPAVANLSWGCSIGPNDGSSLFSQALDNLTGPGRIFVNSAGNNGDENLHLMKQFTATDSLLQSFINLPNVVGEKRSWVDIWGDTAQQFEVQLSLYNGVNIQQRSGYFTLNAALTDTFLVGSNNDTLYFKLTASAADYNGKPHVLIDLLSKTTNSICLSIKAKNNKTHAWLGFVNDYNGYYGSFTKNGQSWAVDGDSKYTLGEMSCTRSAITVAAYVSKNAFRNLAGQNQSYSGYAVNNQIAPFSSIGPTVDGRTKPDIAAPGMTIASAVNSFDVSYTPSGSNYASSVATINRNGRNYYYAEASGTSMSAPMMSGIVALMLQVNPQLNPERIKGIINKTVIKDNFTTQNPDSTRWGAGKVNAYAAVKQAIQTVGLQQFSSKNGLLFEVYPNPNNGSFTIDVFSNQSSLMLIELINLLGKSVYKETKQIELGENRFPISLMNLPQGMYLLNIGGNTQKILVNNY